MIARLLRALQAWVLSWFRPPPPVPNPYPDDVNASRYDWDDDEAE